MCTRRLWERASFSIGVLLGDLKVRFIYGRPRETIKRPLEVECVYRSSVSRSWSECSLTGVPEGYITEGSGDRHLFP